MCRLMFCNASDDLDERKYLQCMALVSKMSFSTQQGHHFGPSCICRILARKSVFCYRTPDFVDGPFVALDHIFDLAPSDRFLNFSFPSYGVSPSGLRPKNLHFFTLHPYNPNFLGSDGSESMGSLLPHILR